MPRPLLQTVGRFGRRLSDRRVVEAARAGDESAFELLYDRYHRGLLSFCRHMLGDAQEAEDAVQQTFLDAYGGLAKSDGEMRLAPWLYRIARNNCVSILRSRREESEEPEPSTVGLAPQVEAREELRSLLGDLTTIPEAQRTALLLSALGDLSHAEIARVLDCERSKVKSLVFRATKALEASREAREVGCDEIRGQLEELRGGSLRRMLVREHLRQCKACRAYRAQVRRRRAAAALRPQRASNYR